MSTPWIKKPRLMPTSLELNLHESAKRLVLRRARQCHPKSPRSAVTVNSLMSGGRMGITLLVVCQLLSPECHGATYCVLPLPNGCIADTTQAASEALLHVLCRHECCINTSLTLPTAATNLSTYLSSIFKDLQQYFPNHHFESTFLPFQPFRLDLLHQLLVLSDWGPRCKHRIPPQRGHPLWSLHSTATYRSLGSQQLVGC